MHNRAGTTQLGGDLLHFGGRLGGCARAVLAARRFRLLFALVAAFATCVTLSAGASASIRHPAHAHFSPHSTGCTNLSNVNLTVGSTLITISPGQFVHGDVGDTVYGADIATATRLIFVKNSTSASMSNPALVTNADATITLCSPGTGSVTCTSVTGLWKFSPGLLTKAQSENVTEYLKIGGCTTSAPTSDGSLVTPHVVSYDPFKSTVQGVSLSCADFDTATHYTDTTVSTTGKVSWNTPKAPSSSFTFTSFGITAPNGMLLISFPSASGSVSVTGGYAGSSASLSLFTNPNLGFSSQCTTIKGVASLVIQGGTVTFG